MKPTLIIYSSTDGQTKKICLRIQSSLDQNVSSKLVSLNDASKENLDKFDRIIIGASIRYGKHKKELFEFINLNLDQIIRKENAFFSVNVVARKSEKNTPQTNPYMQKFLLNTLWKPDYLAVFAGKIDYPKYNFIDKQMIRLIMWITKGPTDTSGIYEFTNWDDVDSFAKQIVA